MPSTSPTKPSGWRKAAAILLFVAACGATLLVAFYQVEKMRGRAAWQAYEAEARARGVKMMLTDYAPPEVPDDENYAAIPLFGDTFRAQAAGQPPLNPLALPQVDGLKQPPLDNLAKQQRIDLAAWQKYFVETKLLSAASENAAADILTALAQYDAPLAQLREAGERPRCRFPVRYEDGISAALPHLAILQAAGKQYVLRLAAHLALGQREKALEDFRDSLRLYTATMHEPTLIAGLVRLSVLALLENAVWGGLAGGQWGDAELTAIETALAPLRLFADYQLGMSSERGFSNHIYSTLHTQSTAELAKLLSLASTPAVPSGPSPGAAVFVLSLYPRGWFYFSQVRGNQYLDEMLARTTVDPPRLDTSRPVTTFPGKPTSLLERTRYMLFFLLAPTLENLERRYAYAQTLTDETRLACALERHRLARGSFPEQLDALTPDFIPSVPRDVMTGDPLHYRLLDGGQRFQLYSVAFNQQDDAGETGGKTSVNDYLDWTWPSAAK